MVVDIEYGNASPKVVLATTYTGCPAADVIPKIVVEHLKKYEFDNPEVVMSISPPWSTEWISEAGRQKLEESGIAPPGLDRLNDTDPGRPYRCPQCGSTNTKRVSAHGSTPCKASYTCEDCLEPFEYFKCF